MQCFPHPSQRFKFSQTSIDSLLKENTLFDCFPIYSIHILLPGSEHLIENVMKALTSDENQYLIVREIVPSALAAEEFLEHFLKRGSLNAFSYQAKAEENFVAIIPPGKLMMSLENEIAQSLSFKKEQHHGQKKKMRQNHQSLIIELNSKDFTTGRKAYDSALFELKKLNDMKFDLLFKWIPDGNICPQSLRSYFEKQGYECIVCEPSHTHHSKLSVTAPKMNFTQFDQVVAEDVLEWIGAQICGIEYSQGTENFVSNFHLPEPSESLQKLQAVSFKGFYCGDKIRNLMKEVKAIFKDDKTLPFVAVSLSGYQDCYVIRKGLQKLSSADKIISVVIFPDLDCWVMTLNIS